jgi:hypothetical protein
MSKPKTDIQTLTQLEEGLAEALDRFEPAAAQLHEATKTINEQVESFKILSQIVQEQIKSSIKTTTNQIAESVAKEFTSVAEKQISDILQPFERSVQYALRALHDTKRRKRVRLVVVCCMSCLITGLIGFGVGYYWCYQWMNSTQEVRSLSTLKNENSQSLLQNPGNVSTKAKKSDKLGKNFK